MAAAAVYEAVSTSDDDDTKVEEGSIASPISTASTFASPPFLSIAEPRFTPLSMDSDLFPTEDDVVASDKEFSPLLTHGMVVGIPSSALIAQSPSRQRANAAKAHALRPPPEWQDSGSINLATKSTLSTSPEEDFRNRIHGDKIRKGRETLPERDLAGDIGGKETRLEVQDNKIVGLISPTAQQAPPLSAAFRGRCGPPNKPNAVRSEDSSKKSNAPSSTSTLPISNFNRNFSTTSTSSSSSSIISQIHEHIQQQSHSAPGPHPIIRTVSDSHTFTVRHPVPDLNTRSGAYLGNIAQLEATAERLSMTSSIEDAIRDLHGELKRSDSRRSSILAASIKGGSEPDDSAIPPTLPRHLSATSIVEINSAARHGGYSPSGYVMSPSHSLTNRLRSASKTSSVRSEMDFDTAMSRHGPGKGSQQSMRSGKISLAEIAESEPVALTQEALDEADRATLSDEDDETIRPHAEMAALNTDSFHAMLNGGYFHDPAPELGLASPKDAEMPTQGRERPLSSHSTNTFDQAQNAFADFDGTYYEPESSLPTPPEPELLSAPELRPSRPSMLPPRPTSYFDPVMGQQMLYYPARVPMMLNLPQKLSKKPKVAMRNQRQSRVLDAMGSDARQSATWLPDPLEGHANSPFSPHSLDTSPLSHPEPSPLSDSHSEVRKSFVEMEPQPSEISTGHDAPPMPMLPPQARQRSPRRIDPDNRKSRLSNMDGLPPQLRASAFFDLPSTSSPVVEVKDGSAMATLDSILDASANAPVSAFTDHAFAGKLGDEVYGREKKRKSAMPSKRPTSASGPKKHSSFLTIRGVSKESERRNTFTTTSAIAANGIIEEEDEKRPLSAGVDGETALKPDQDEIDESDELEEDEVYQGPPTTLLAELQLRKQQQKLRTRPINRVYPNGMHSTLLQLEAVAEKQRDNRKGKRVILAWEDPTASKPEDESDDEDVPLGMLFAAKAAGNNDISAVAADLSRPLGLMERREIEDNEPLSVRRARLQGREPEQLTVLKRRSMMALNRSAMMTGAMQSPDHVEGFPSGEQVSEEEVEGETLGERMRRLRAKEEAENPLPRARPVSGAFSAELLSQFGDLDDAQNKKDSSKTKDTEGKGKENVSPLPQAPEEEETLGQRRRRLQAEREAREREIGAVPAGNNNADGSRLTRRLSMADILSAHPKQEADRREAERIRLEVERRAASREHEAKMRSFRGEMAGSLAAADANRNFGFRNVSGGSFGDVGAPAVPMHQSIGSELQGPGLSPNYGTTMGPGGMNRASMAYGGFGNGASMSLPMPMMAQQQQHASYNTGRGFAGGAFNSGLGPYGGTTPGVGGPGMNGFGAPQMAMPTPMHMQMPMQMGMGMPMTMGPGMGMPMQAQFQMPGMPANQGQMDSIERWRQSVMP
jgi:hypothetical protein